MNTARADRISPPQFTRKQGQYLAFIHYYWLLNGRGPAEADLVRFFGVTPPSVHSMIVKLHELGLIAREPGVARSVRVAIPDEYVPTLGQRQGPPQSPGAPFRSRC